LLEKAQALDDNWGENGRLRLAAHMTIGGLTGGLGGALGAGAGTLTAPQINALLADSNLAPELRQTLIALASTAAGVAAGVWQATQ
jgi:filamentous hemagglutinin